MQIEREAWSSVTVDVWSGRDLGGEQAKARAAWLLQMEREHQSLWRCEALAPRERATATRPLDQPPTAAAMVQHRARGGPDILGAQPYGIHVLADPRQGRTDSSLDGVSPDDPGVGCADTAIFASIGEDALLSLHDALRQLGHAPAVPLTLQVMAPPIRPFAAVQDGRMWASARAMVAERHLNMEQPLIPVRLHIEQGDDGRLSVWLGVSEGAGAHAMELIAALRELVRRRGGEFGVVCVNGKVLNEGSQDEKQEIFPDNETLQTGEH